MLGFTGYMSPNTLVTQGWTRFMSIWRTYLDVLSGFQTQTKMVWEWEEPETTRKGVGHNSPTGAMMMRRPLGSWVHSSGQGEVAGLIYLGFWRLAWAQEDMEKPQSWWSWHQEGGRGRSTALSTSWSEQIVTGTPQVQVLPNAGQPSHLCSDRGFHRSAFSYSQLL